MDVLKQLYSKADYKDTNGMVFNTDCMCFMSDIEVGGYLMLLLPIYRMQK